MPWVWRTRFTWGFGTFIQTWSTTVKEFTSTPYRISSKKKKRKPLTPFRFPVAVLLKLSFSGEPTVRGCVQRRHSFLRPSGFAPHRIRSGARPSVFEGLVQREISIGYLSYVIALCDCLRFMLVLAKSL